MTRSMKLIDENVICTESLQDYLQDNTEFLVVGIVGPQGVGKSTILNMLIHNELTDDIKKDLFKSSRSTDEHDSDKEHIKLLTENLSNINIHKDNKNTKNKVIFKIESSDDIENGLHKTQGIDIFVTNNRVSIFLNLISQNLIL